MSDHPADIHDGPDPEPVPEGQPIAVGDHVKLLVDLNGVRLKVSKKEMLIVQHINSDGTADCRIVRAVTVPLTQLRRWQ